MFIGLIWPRDEEHVLARDVLFHSTARKTSAEATRDAQRLLERLAANDAGVGAYIVALEGERVREMWTLEDAKPHEAQWVDGRFVRMRVLASDVKAWLQTKPVTTWEADGKHATLDWPCDDAALASELIEALNGRRANGPRDAVVDKRVLSLLDKIRGQGTRYDAAVLVKRELNKIEPPPAVAKANAERAAARQATSERTATLMREFAAAGGTSAAQEYIDELERQRADAPPEERARIERDKRAAASALKKLEELEVLALEPAKKMGKPTEFVWYDGRRVEVIVGKATEVLVPDSKGAPTRYEARYALVRSAELGTSHDPWSFKPRPGYDQALQERDYATSEHEQAKVIFGATWFEPRFVLNSTPSAIDGPPVISTDGTVLGGNGRGMMLLRAMREKSTYRDLLRVELTLAPKIYGLTSAGEELVLVRMLTGKFDAKDISSRLNAAFTQSLGDHAKAVSIGARLPAEVLEIIAEGLDDGSLADTLRTRSREVVEALRDSGVIQPAELAEWTTQRGGKMEDNLSNEGRDRIRSALVGAVVDDVETLTYLEHAALRDLIERIAPVVLAVEQLEAPLNKDYSMLKPLRAAVREASRVVTLTPTEFAEHYSNLSLLGGDATADPEVAAWVLWLWEHARGKRVAGQRAALQAWRSLPKSSNPLFGDFDKVTRERWFELWGLGPLDPRLRSDPQGWLVEQAKKRRAE